MKLIISFFCFIAIYFTDIETKAENNLSNNEILKIGLIAPLTGEYENIGKSILNSLRIGLNKVNNKKIEIYPKDNQSDPEKTLQAAKELEQLGVSVVIGPIFYENLFYLDELENLVFLSLTNRIKDLPKNVISVGINADSQFESIVSFLKKEKLSKTIVLIPKSQNESEIKYSISKKKHQFYKIYSYDVDPEKLTKKIQQITRYAERKEDLRRRIKILEKSDLTINKKKIEKLKMRYTIGKVNFDSVIIADFDESLKSVTTSFLYSDVNPKKIKFITLNQWFDETLFKENSTKDIYFPSINKDNYNKFRETYFINFKKYPSEIAVISYDILGLIYYVAKKNNGQIKKKFFSKNKFSGEVGNFELKNNTIDYKLDFYQVSEKKFKKVN